MDDRIRVYKEKKRIDWGNLKNKKTGMGQTQQNTDKREGGRWREGEREKKRGGGGGESKREREDTCLLEVKYSALSQNKPCARSF